MECEDIFINMQSENKKRANCENKFGDIKNFFINLLDETQSQPH